MRNVYRANLRDMRFVLWEQLDVERHILSSPLYPELDKQLMDGVLTQARDFSYRELGPLYQSGDREGCELGPDGRVRLPSGYDKAWAAYKKFGWGRAGLPSDSGGLGTPYALSMPVQEMFCGANPTIVAMFGFCAPLFYLLRRYGSAELQALFCEKLASNQWSACLCITEPGAGTDVGCITTSATARDDGTFAIRGTKIFISAGSHELAGNIAYVVLARAEGAPPGTLGLSVFLVPRFRVDANGSVVGENNVRCVRLEEKMGLHGMPTAQLSFGDGGESVGYLLGDRLNIGLQQLRMMMNQARIATGIFALGLASSASINAAEYAAERIQGCDYRQTFNPRAARLPIADHTDVRRMLMEMKCKVEGCRALIYKLAFHVTKSQMLDASGTTDVAEKQKHDGLVNLLTPIVKAYTSDQAWRVAELAIQVHGGYGYTKDFPVEQYARDVKILSIWEGTNYVQAVDLLRDKLAMGNNRQLLAQYLAEIEGFLNRTDAPQNPLHQKLRDSVSALTDTVAVISDLVRAKKIETVLLYATRFLGMMSTVTIGWLLLEAATIAERALANIPDDHPDVSFYRGKILSAQFFFGQFVPSVLEDAGRIRVGEDSVLGADSSVFLI